MQKQGGSKPTRNANWSRGFSVSKLKGIVDTLEKKRSASTSARNSPSHHSKDDDNTQLILDSLPTFAIQAADGSTTQFQTTNVMALLDEKPIEEFKFASKLSIKWFRASLGGSFEQIEGVEAWTYQPSVNDVDSRICAQLLVTGSEGLTAFAEYGPVEMDPAVVEKVESLLEAPPPNEKVNQMVRFSIGQDALQELGKRVVEMTGFSHSDAEENIEQGVNSSSHSSKENSGEAVKQGNVLVSLFSTSNEPTAANAAKQFLVGNEIELEPPLVSLNARDCGLFFRIVPSSNQQVTLSNCTGSASFNLYCTTSFERDVVVLTLRKLLDIYGISTGDKDTDLTDNEGDTEGEESLAIDSDDGIAAEDGSQIDSLGVPSHPSSPVPEPPPRLLRVDKEVTTGFDKQPIGSFQSPKSQEQAPCSPTTKPEVQAPCTPTTKPEASEEPDLKSELTMTEADVRKESGEEGDAPASREIQEERFALESGCSETVAEGNEGPEKTCKQLLPHDTPCKDLEETVKTLRDEKMQLERKVEEMSALQEERVTLERRNATLEREVKTMGSELRTARSTITELKKEKTEKDAQLESTHLELGHHREQLEVYKEKLKTNQEALGILTNELRELKVQKSRESSETVIETGKTLAEIEQQKKLIATLENDLVTQGAENLKAMNENEELSKNLEEAVLDLSKNREELKDRCFKVEEQEKQLLSESEKSQRLEKQVKKYKQTLEEMSTNVEQTGERMIQLEKEFKTKELHAQGLQKKLEAAEQQLELTRAARNGLQRKTDSLVKDVSRIVHAAGTDDLQNVELLLKDNQKIKSDLLVERTKNESLLARLESLELQRARVLAPLHTPTLAPNASSTSSHNTEQKRSGALAAMTQSLFSPLPGKRGTTPNTQGSKKNTINEKQLQQLANSLMETLAERDESLAMQRHTSKMLSARVLELEDLLKEK